MANQNPWRRYALPTPLPTDVFSNRSEARTQRDRREPAYAIPILFPMLVEHVIGAETRLVGGGTDVESLRGPDVIVRIHKFSSQPPNKHQIRGPCNTISPVTMVFRG